MASSIGIDCDPYDDQKSIYSTNGAYAALETDGNVVAQGHMNVGRDCSKVQDQLAADVQSIYSIDAASAVLKADGAMVPWRGGTVA